MRGLHTLLVSLKPATSSTFQTHRDRLIIEDLQRRLATSHPQFLALRDYRLPVGFDQVMDPDRRLEAYWDLFDASAGPHDIAGYPHRFLIALIVFRPVRLACTAIIARLAANGDVARTRSQRGLTVDCARRTITLHCETYGDLPGGGPEFVQRLLDAGGD